MEVVGEANCGIEALDLIDELKPDIILKPIDPSLITKLPTCSDDRHT